MNNRDLANRIPIEYQSEELKNVLKIEKNLSVKYAELEWELVKSKVNSEIDPTKENISSYNKVRREFKSVAKQISSVHKKLKQLIKNQHLDFM